MLSKLLFLTHHLRRVLMLNGSPKIFSWGSASDTSNSGLLFFPVCMFSTAGFADPQLILVCTLLQLLFNSAGANTSFNSPCPSISVLLISFWLYAVSGLQECRASSQIWRVLSGTGVSSSVPCIDPFGNSSSSVVGVISFG